MEEGALLGAVDIGGTKVAVSVAGRAGPLARVTEPTVKEGAERALPDQVIRLLGQACAQAGADAAQLRTIGVASCGPFIRKAGYLAVSTPNICGGLANATDLPNDWVAIPLEAVLRERFERVEIENDGVAALVAERTFGAAVGEPDCVYATWSTGVGFGLCVNGRILRGKHGNAGHGGHMLMSEARDVWCGCGNRGDLEALIAGRSLGEQLGMSTPALFAAARNGDRRALEVAEDAARWFGRGLYN
ncbi:MAG TPA: ROK family protein, partial [Noviherbaspirillum sp.]|nr:ROK family protein [Noviherbaspirillum sp.]